mmetsp:Transcript_1985/g.4371  ORF Transcript_1985/g.4371 Transcript_1985/m.4371 type:complete len:81 (+) Transcript_1985:796-1038(+)
MGLGKSSSGVKRRSDTIDAGDINNLKHGALWASADEVKPRRFWKRPREKEKCKERDELRQPEKTPQGVTDQVVTESKESM